MGWNGTVLGQHSSEVVCKGLYTCPVSCFWNTLVLAELLPLTEHTKKIIINIGCQIISVGSYVQKYYENQYGIIAFHNFKSKVPWKCLSVRARHPTPQIGSRV
jgi:hypothetical protein